MALGINEESPLVNWGRGRATTTTNNGGCSSTSTSIKNRVPLVNRLFGGGAGYRTSELIRRSSSRRVAGDEESGGGDGSSSNSNSNNMPGLKKVLEELEANNGTSQRKILLGLFAIFNHFAGGVISMMVLEGWSLPDAAYFSVVTLTTVGYGDLSPTTGWSKLFVIYYSVVSIAIVSSYLAYFVGQFIDKQEELILSKIIRGYREGDSSSTDNGGGDSILEDEALLKREDYHGLYFSLCVLAAVLACGTAIFARMEGFPILDSFYATVISATTVGFGDLHPRNPSTKLLMTFWLAFSTVALAKVVADFTECRLLVKQRKITRRVLTAQLDTCDLKALDANADGEVDWGEFLESTLVACKKVTREEMNSFKNRFRQLDKDTDGVIDVHTCR